MVYAIMGRRFPQPNHPWLLLTIFANYEDALAWCNAPHNAIAWGQLAVQEVEVIQPAGRVISDE